MQKLLLHQAAKPANLNSKVKAQRQHLRKPRRNGRRTVNTRIHTRNHPLGIKKLILIPAKNKNITPLQTLKKTLINLPDNLLRAGYFHCNKGLIRNSADIGHVNNPAHPPPPANKPCLLVIPDFSVNVPVLKRNIFAAE